MCVPWNGPEIGECDDILRKELDLYFEKTRLGLHFKTNILFITAGPTVNNILRRKNKFNIAHLISMSYCFILYVLLFFIVLYLLRIVFW